MKLILLKNARESFFLVVRKSGLYLPLLSKIGLLLQALSKNSLHLNRTLYRCIQFRFFVLKIIKHELHVNTDGEEEYYKK